MLLLKDSRAQCVSIVRIEDGNHFLQNDDSVVQLLVDEMHRAACDFYSIGKRLLLCVETGKSRQQRRMNVQDTLRKCLYELRGEKPHVSGETDQVDAVLPQAADDLRVMLGALASAGFDGQCFQAPFAGGVQAGGIGFIGDDNRNLGSRQLSAGNGIGDR